MAVRQRRQAFTLVEILLVVAVMVMIAAIGYPAVESFYLGVKVEAASDAVRAGWSEAQAHAVGEGRPYRFAIVPGKGNYRYAPDSADFWSGGTPKPDQDNPFIIVQGRSPTVWSSRSMVRPPRGTAKRRIRTIKCPRTCGPPRRSSCPTARRRTTPTLPCAYKALDRPRCICGP